MSAFGSFCTSAKVKRTRAYPGEPIASQDQDHRSNVSSQIFPSRWIAAAFILYSLTAAVFLAINVPPFQVPDELSHFERAAQIADGTLIGARVWMTGADGSAHPTSGGSIDPAILSSAAPFTALHRWFDQKARPAYWAADHWSAARVVAGFPNTAVYPPFFYAPSALGIVIGRAAGLTVLQTLTLSRVLTAAAAIVLGGVAIACAGGWCCAMDICDPHVADVAVLACIGLSGRASHCMWRGLRSTVGACHARPKAEKSVAGGACDSAWLGRHGATAIWSPRCCTAGIVWC